MKTMMKFEKVASAVLLLALAACSGSNGNSKKSAGDGPLSDLYNVYWAPLKAVEQSMEGVKHNQPEYMEAYYGAKRKAEQELKQSLEGKELETEVFDAEMSPYSIEKPFVVKSVELQDDVHNPITTIEGTLKVLDPQALSDGYYTSNYGYSDAKSSLYGVLEDKNYCLLGTLYNEHHVDSETRELNVKVILDYLDRENAYYRDSLLSHATHFVVVYKNQEEAEEIAENARKTLAIARYGKDPVAERAQLEKEVEESSFDLRFFNLHGPVKSCTYKDNGKAATFSKDGKLTSYTEFGAKMIVKRNEQGQIISTEEVEPEDPDWVIYYSYTWEDGYVHTETIDTAEGSITMKYYYGLYGKVERAWVESINEFDGPMGVNRFYAETETDAHGNWTKREIRDEGDVITEERTIVYY